MANEVALVVAELARRGQTIAVAESLTGGLLADAFVRVPGASAAFSGGVVSYATGVKASVLGVDADLLAERGAVDADVAVEMARGVRRTVTVAGVEATYGVATTGVAGPDPQDGKAVGTVFVAVSDARRDSVRALHFSGDRASIRQAAVDAALALTIEFLGDHND